MRPVQGSHIFTGMRPMRSRQVAIPPTLDMRNRVVIWRTRRGVALLAMPQRKATRLGEHDYSRQGYYFVTVCARSRRSAFGEIEGGKMCLNALGALTEERWREIPGHFPDAGLDEFIVMPNHIHGIVIIGEANCSGRGAYMRPLQSERRDADRSKMRLSRIMQGFKASVTRTSRKRWNDRAFGWQRSFYDHIIRSDAELNRVREYIRNNPLKWAFDRYNPTNRP